MGNQDGSAEAVFARVAATLRPQHAPRINFVYRRWSAAPDEPFDRLLRTQRILDDDEYALIARVVDSVLAHYSGDASAALNSLSQESALNEAELDRRQRLAETRRTGSVTEADVTGQPLIEEAPGRYSRESHYRRGGMGQILLAYDEVIGRDVAVKELLPDAASQAGDDLLARFLQEARITGQLEHPAIVPIYELGRRPNGSIYYTMKYVKGRTLADAIHSAKTFHDRLKLLPHFVDLCQALAYAHSRGVVHRDIKPTNVLVGEFGETVVIDWGLAKVITANQTTPTSAEGESQVRVTPVGNPALTQAGTAMGTPAYMSPEQALGRQVTERSDVYALGAVLYELLTGQPPHTGVTFTELMHKVSAEPVAPVRQLESNAPPDLAAICERALVKSPEDRYASAAELADEVSRFQSGALVQAYEYGLREHLARFARRRAAVLITAATALFVLGVGGIASYVSVVQQRNAAVQARADERAARIGEETARKAADRDNYLASLAAAKNLAEAGLYGRANEFLWRTSEELRSWEWGFLLRRSNPDFATLSGHAGPVLGAAFNLDGSHVLTLADDRTVRHWDATMGRTLRVEPGHLRNVSMQQLKFVVSPNGKLAATISDNIDGTVGVWDLQTGERIYTFGNVEEQHAAYAAFSPDSSKLVSGGFSCYLWDLSNGSLEHKFTEREAVIFAVAFDPTGNRIVASTSDGRVVMYGVPSYGKLWQQDGAGRNIEQTLFSQDGTVVVAFVSDGDVKAYDADTGRVRYTIEAAAWPFVTPVLLPDGERIAHPGRVSGVDIREIRTGRLTDRLETDSSRVSSIARSEHPGRIAVGTIDGTIRMYDAADLHQADSVVAHADEVATLRFSADGARLISGSADRTVRIWPGDFRMLSTGFEQLDANDSEIVATAIAHDAPIAAVLHRSGIVDIWNLETWRKKKSYNVSALPPGSVALSPDGDRLIVGSMENATPIIDLQDGSLICLLYGHSGGIATCRFSVDGTRVITGASDKKVRLWDAQTGELLRESVADGTVTAAAFHPAGLSAAFGDATGELALWDLESKLPEPLEPAHSATVTSVAFTRGGDRLVTTSADGTIRVWRTDKVALDRDLRGHDKSVRRAEFILGDTRIVSAGEDGRVRLWDPARGDEVATIELDGASILGVEWRADELLIASADAGLWVASADPYSNERIPGRSGKSWKEMYGAYKSKRNAPRTDSAASAIVCAIAPPDQVRRRFATLWDSVPEMEWAARAAAVSGDRSQAAMRSYGFRRGDEIVLLDNKPIASLSDLKIQLDRIIAKVVEISETRELICRVSNEGLEREVRIRVQPRRTVVQEVTVPFDQAVMLLRFGIPMIAANAEGMHQMQSGSFGLWEVPTLGRTLDGIWVAYFENPDGPLSPVSRLFLQGIDLMGLRIYDRVMEVDGEPLTSINALKGVADRALAALNADGRADVNFVVYRGSFLRVELRISIPPKAAPQ